MVKRAKLLILLLRTFRKPRINDLARFSAEKLTMWKSLRNCNYVKSQRVTHALHIEYAI